MFLKLIINLILLALLTLNISSIYAEDAIDKDYTENYNYAAITNKCEVYDPYESFNRKIFIVNGVLDSFILRPITKGYDKVTNGYTKERVSSFSSNIREPLSFINYGIQGNSENSFKSFWRFTINSTFGIAGLFDVASKVGLTSEQQTFGNTLAHYGVGSGPYIILPLYGGMGARDLLDPLVMNNALNPVKHFMHKDFKLASTVISTIDTRHQIMPFTDYISKNSTDPYIAVRDATISNREAKMLYPDGFKCPAVNKK